jgi:hypothetical protein
LDWDYPPGLSRAQLSFASAGLDVPAQLIAGVWLFRPSQRPLGEDRVIVMGGYVSADFDVGVITQQGGRVEVRDTVIEARVGFLWGARNHGSPCGLDALVDGVRFLGCRFAIFENVTCPLSSPGEARVRHRRIVLEQERALSGRWSRTTRAPGQLLVSGSRLIIGEVAVDPNTVEVATRARVTPGAVFGLPGDILRVKDPSSGETFEWRCEIPNAEVDDEFVVMPFADLPRWIPVLNVD